MNPLRQSFTVQDREGTTYPFSLELADYSLAQRELGVKLTPFGATEFWTSIDEDPVYANLVTLYVGLRRAGINGLSLNWLVDRFPTELLLGEVAKTLEAAMADFSQRIVSKGRRDASEAQTNPAQTSPNSGRSQLSTSA